MPRMLLLLGILLGQPAPIDPPSEFQPLDFSNIVGKYDIKVTATPTEVLVEDPITLRVEITGTGPEKYEPNRKHLRLFPDDTFEPAKSPEAASWRRDFYRQELPDQHEVGRDKKTWVFVYRLKPKHTKAGAIDDIKLVYYDPNLPDKIKYVTKYADGIKIKVMPRPAKKDVEVPGAAAPDTFFEVVPGTSVLGHSKSPWVLRAWQLAILFALPPMFCLGAVLAWRRVFPDEGRRMLEQRDSAARRALAQLGVEGASARDVVRLYLVERFEFAVEDPTPAEVGAFLKRRGFALPVCAQSQAFLQACDAVQFTGAPVDAKPLKGEAIRLIEALEADPCA